MKTEPPGRKAILVAGYKRDIPDPHIYFIYPPVFSEAGEYFYTMTRNSLYGGDGDYAREWEFPVGELVIIEPTGQLAFGAADGCSPGDVVDWDDPYQRMWAIWRRVYPEDYEKETDTESESDLCCEH